MRNLGSNTVGFTSRSFWFEPRTHLGYNFHKEREELNHDNSKDSHSACMEHCFYMKYFIKKERKEGRIERRKKERKD